MLIPEIKLTPTPESDEAKSALGFKYNDVAGHRHKLGGTPEPLQAFDHPICCDKDMTFYAQLDSIGDKHNLADCGLIYVFVCFDCFNVTSFLQSS